MESNLQINKLYSGGLITNYYCTSTCKHCLYACSPKWDKDYIAQDKASEYFKLVKSLNCHSLHIGGGEPLLKPEKLAGILKVAKKKMLKYNMSKPILHGTRMTSLQSIF